MNKDNHDQEWIQILEGNSVTYATNILPSGNGLESLMAQSSLSDWRAGRRDSEAVEYACASPTK